MVARRGAARSGSRRSSRGSRARWPDIDAEAIAERQPQAGDDARTARRSSSRSARRPGSSCRRPTARTGPDRRRAARARRASCSRCGRAAVETDALRARRRRRDRVPPGDAAAVRHPGVGDRRDAARAPRPPASTSTALEITTCLRRGEVEIVTRYEPAAAGDLRRVRGGRARAPRRARCSPTTATSVDEQVADAAARRRRARSRRPSRAPAG